MLTKVSRKNPTTTPGGEMKDLTTPEGVAAHMSESTSEADWNERCDEVEAANDGYPSFWFATVIMSGLADKTLGAGSSNIKIN
ncbi:MAG TPA: hypothetical protein VGO98_01955 [Candidatus Saccharimonadales bacterium]|nr:hypothetical protein [Candidatus Saccharimonadales bacterium]